MKYCTMVNLATLGTQAIVDLMPENLQTRTEVRAKPTETRAKSHSSVLAAPTANDDH